ncbi:hypothetical protein B0H10DRAFT_2210785 [Mycena sp. CBHHK59/15]|nr:hypothetical protein B0H10DRAFT_2210785 [Mycena sp. CBHHK59/15]
MVRATTNEERRTPIVRRVLLPENKAESWRVVLRSRSAERKAEGRTSRRSPRGGALPRWVGTAQAGPGTHPFRYPSPLPMSPGGCVPHTLTPSPLMYAHHPQQHHPRGCVLPAEDTACSPRESRADRDWPKTLLQNPSPSLKMRLQEPTLPSISLVLAQHAASPTPTYLVFPWTSVIQNPNPTGQIIVHANPTLTAPQAPRARNRLKDILNAIYRLLLHIVAKLKARGAV